MSVDVMHYKLLVFQISTLKFLVSVYKVEIIFFLSGKNMLFSV